MGPISTMKKTQHRKNVKTEHFEKEHNGLEMWWVGSFPQNVVWIHEAVSANLSLPMTDGWTDRGRMDDGRPRQDSGSADRVNQS